MRSLAIERMAMSSDETVMPNFDCMRKPSLDPPMPMMMLRRAWAQKSMTQPISTFFGSMPIRLRFLFFSWASS